MGMYAGAKKGDWKDASTTSQEDINGDFGRGWAAGMMRSSTEEIWSFYKERKRANNIYRLGDVKQIEKDLKSRCKPHFS